MTKILTKLLIALAACAAVAACGGSASTGNPGGGSTPPPVTATCYSGTPSTNDQFLNACTGSSVTAIDKQSSIPRGASPSAAGLPPIQ